MFFRQPGSNDRETKSKLDALLETSNSSAEFLIDGNTMKNIKKINDRVACLGYGRTLAEKNNLSIKEYLQELNQNLHAAIVGYFKSLLLNTMDDYSKKYPKAAIPELLQTLTPLQCEYLYFAVKVGGHTAGLQDYEYSGISSELYTKMINAAKIPDDKLHTRLEGYGLSHVIENIDSNTITSLRAVSH